MTKPGNIPLIGDISDTFFLSFLPTFPPLPSLCTPPQMIECLKDQKKQLSQRCHQRIFRLQEVEMTDPELDYQLMRVCKQMIKVIIIGAIINTCIFYEMGFD